MKSTEFSSSRRNFIKNTSLAAAGLYLAPGIQGKENIIAYDRPNNVTRYGCMFFQVPRAEAEERMKTAGFNMVRLTVFLKLTNINLNIDKYLAAGFSVALNVDWQPTNVPTTFPSPEEIPILRKRAVELFKKYAQYKDQIPFITVGNEWDNLRYYTNSIDLYLNQLRVVTKLAHKYGFKVADAAISSTALQRWMYSQLSGQEAKQWKMNYFVGNNMPNYEPLLEKVEHYISKIKNIPIDYLNVHWYNIVKCSNGFSKAANTYLTKCNKQALLTNEFGIKTSNLNLWKQTVNEVSSYPIPGGDIVPTQYAVAFSGQGGVNRAIELTDSMLKLLANPTPATFS